MAAKNAAIYFDAAIVNDTIWSSLWLWTPLFVVTSDRGEGGASDRRGCEEEYRSESLEDELLGEARTR